MHPIFKVSGKISPHFRRRRFRKFLETFSPTRSMRILDVGGLPRAWLDVPIESEITILNVTPLDDFEGSFLQPNHIAVMGDGTRLPYEDQSFDIVFSNSVIEHLGTWEKQQAFAAEACRVGKCYWVQTPAKEFPLEPHYFGPFVHWFSKPIQKRLLRNFTLWGLLGRPTNETLDQVLAELRLLNHREFQYLFEDSRMWVERVLGLPKSYTAYITVPQTRFPNHSTRSLSRIFPPLVGAAGAEQTKISPDLFLSEKPGQQEQVSKNKRKEVMKSMIITMGACALLTGQSMAQQSQQDQQQNQGSQQGQGERQQIPGVASKQVQTIKATVQKVDKEKRQVTLKGEGGNTVTVRVPETARNFDQIKVGDTVTARYTQSIAVSVRKSDEQPPSATGRESITRAPEGQSPAATRTATMQITASVEKIDRDKRELTLMGPGGETRTVTVPEDVKKFDELKVGDNVVIRATESVAIQVSSPEK
jgi:hypothetical protein